MYSFNQVDIQYLIRFCALAVFLASFVCESESESERERGRERDQHYAV